MTAKSRREITVMIFEFAERYAAAQDNSATQSALTTTIVDEIIAEADESYDTGYAAAKRGADNNTTHDVLTNMIMRHENNAVTAEVMDASDSAIAFPDGRDFGEPYPSTVHSPNGFHGSTEPNYAAPRTGFVNLPQIPAASGPRPGYVNLAQTPATVNH